VTSPSLHAFGGFAAEHGAGADPVEQGARPDLAEAELVARARVSPDAFAALYRRHYPAIARYVRRRVGDEHVAADLTAEAFLIALERLSRYRERGLPFRSWLYRLASRRVNRWVRRRRLEPASADLSSRAARPGPSEDPSELARRALLALPPRYQSALTLHYLEGLSVAEVARVLLSRPGTIKARLARGRERLRRALEPHARELLR